jgi:uncharacterized protein YbjT (DUF2867 family)
MILIIGAAGNIGFPIVKNLCKKNAKIRAFVHSEKSIERLKALGVTEIFIGDVRKKDDLHNALNGCHSVFHVLPPFSEDEFEIGRQTIELAREAGIDHFVFNSVLHPQLREMPHHAKKLLCEEELIKSGLAFNIIQPAMLMQNILGPWNKIRADGIFPGLSAPDKKFALVDTEDLGEAIANILVDKSLRNATFELAGPDTLTYEEMVAIISEELNKPIKIESLDENRRQLFTKSQNRSPYATETFLKMLRHYDAHGFPGGNKLVLSSILKREPNSYRKFIKRLISEKQQ